MIFKKILTRYSWLFVLLIVISWVFLPSRVLYQFESQYSVPVNELDNYEGIIVLGGAVHSIDVWGKTGQVQLNERAERMVQSLVLLSKYPAFRLIYTGSEITIHGKGLLSKSRAPQAVHFFTNSISIHNQLLFETKSTNTYENAIFSAMLVGADITKPWLLVTSASHMPRAIAVFKKTGWNVTAYPVDFHADRTPNFIQFSLMKGLSYWKLVIYETLAWFEYRLKGWI
jgi:uncharacterized SAM-binding protein YcdF (DUF218 family)